MTYQPPQGQYGPVGPWYQPGAGDSGNGLSPKGFYRALFDFGFNSFVAPKVIKFLYVLVMIVAALGALGELVLAFTANPAFGVVSLVILCPLWFTLVLAFSRVWLEFFMAVFRMAEDMRSIRVRGGAGMPQS